MDHDLSGRVLGGRFELISPLGEGGYGAVYVARQLSMDRKVAVKVIHPKVAEAEDFVGRFEREARVASRLQHQNTVVYFDFGHDDGIHFLAMELVKGRSLGDLLVDEGPLSVVRSAHMAKQICGALAEAHDQNMVHRDLKPANILVTQRGNDPDFIKVIDFGLAKIVQGDERSRGKQDLTSEGVLLGTPSYMAPEQIRGHALDGRCDIYALGVILFVMLSGRKPYDGDTPLGTAVMHLTEPIPRLREVNARIPAEVEELVFRCMAKDPADRPQSVQAIASEMDAWMAGIGPTRSGSMYVTDVMPRVGVGPIEGVGSGRFDPPPHTQTLDPTPSSGKRLMLGSISGQTARPVDETLHRGQPEPSLAAPAPPASRGLLYAGVVAVVLAGGVAGVALTQSNGESVEDPQPAAEAGAGALENEGAEGSAEPLLAEAPAAEVVADQLRALRQGVADAAERALLDIGTARRVALAESRTVVPAPLVPTPEAAIEAAPDEAVGGAERTEAEAEADPVASSERTEREPRRPRREPEVVATNTVAVRSESTNGRLRISAVPWALVWCNEERLGRTPIDREMPSGTYRCRIVSPSGVEEQRTIEVAAGEDGELVRVRFDR